jgi:hypothetical protein
MNHLAPGPETLVRPSRCSYFIVSELTFLELAPDEARWGQVFGFEFYGQALHLKDYSPKLKSKDLTPSLYEVGVRPFDVAKGLTPV